MQVVIPDNVDSPIYFSDIMVDPKLRGAGKGTQMMTEMEDFLSARYPGRPIELELLPSATQAEKLKLFDWYERLGYKMGDDGMMRKFLASPAGDIPVVGGGTTARRILPSTLGEPAHWTKLASTAGRGMEGSYRTVAAKD